MFGSVISVASSVGICFWSGVCVYFLEYKFLLTLIYVSAVVCVNVRGLVCGSY